MEPMKMDRLKLIVSIRNLDDKDFYDVLHVKCDMTECSNCILLHNFDLCNLAYKWSKQ